MGRLSFSSLFDKMELHAVGTAHFVKCKLIDNYEQCIAKVVNTADLSQNHRVANGQQQGLAKRGV